jgi:hypothetical protein
MSFGFPASHTRITHLDAGSDKIPEIILEALENLGWSITSTRPKYIAAKVGVTLLSWGEKIKVRFRPDGTVSVTSKCALFTQCVDWGKNKKNVDTLIAEIHSLA